ncbi:MAG: Obg family GTPase CgtA [Clostridia bacterium]|nr:Obg family GTPase CgtA [Clostridia bacterium]
MGAVVRILPTLPEILVFEEEEVEETFETNPYEVHRNDDGTFEVSGPLTERLLASVNFAEQDSLNYFHRTLRARGVIDALRAAGAGEGDTVVFGDMEFDFVE